MNPKPFISAAALGLLLLAGCDQRPKSSSQTNGHSRQSVSSAIAAEPKALLASVTQPAANAPATQPAEEPHSTFFVASAQAPQAFAYHFPRARLHLASDHKSAIVYSDDPKTAIDSKYAGNGYYLEIALSDEALQHLDGYQWHYKAASSEHEDSTDGIFLQGQRYQLQPNEVVVTFEGQAPMMNVVVQGTFYQFDMSQGIREGTLVNVRGMLSATVDAPK